MANPFTSFVFDATGETQAPNTRTLPDRLAEITNVKDWGATGLGFPNDDWAAITAAFNWTSGNSLGIIYFPPGTYYVSAPIALLTNLLDKATGTVRGEMGLSTASQATLLTMFLIKVSLLMLP